MDPRYVCRTDGTPHKMYLTRTKDTALEWCCMNCIFRMVIMRWAWDVMIGEGRMAKEEDRPMGVF